MLFLIQALMLFLILLLEYALIIVELSCMRKDAVGWESLREVLVLWSWCVCRLSYFYSHN